MIIGIVIASCACCKCCPLYEKLCCASSGTGCGTRSGEAAVHPSATAAMYGPNKAVPDTNNTNQQMIPVVTGRAVVLTTQEFEA
eukprot:scaffold9726_cov92-Amphora_coffeaeformis.AAC.1